MKEGTGRGAGGSCERQPPFPGGGGSCAVLLCPAAEEGRSRDPHTGEELRGCGAPSGAPQSQEPQPNKQVPSGPWSQGNLVGIFFPGTKIDGMYLFAAPGQERRNPLEWEPGSCSVPCSRAWSPETPEVCSQGPQCLL